MGASVTILQAPRKHVPILTYSNQVFPSLECICSLLREAAFCQYLLLGENKTKVESGERRFFFRSERDKTYASGAQSN